MDPTTAESPIGHTGHTLRTVLVVEDEEPIRTATSEFLRDCGFVVIEAGDVTEAKDLLLNWNVDLVFSDINLPNRESGFALENWIRHYYPSVKVLLTSGHPQLSADTRNLREPIIQKPYSYLALLRRIDSAFKTGNLWHR
jgi:DNA-binding NtrC family response regulator